VAAGGGIAVLPSAQIHGWLPPRFVT
jgi:hypothetical protein